MWSKETTPPNGAGSSNIAPEQKEQISAINSSLREKHAEFVAPKRGRGRPRKDGSPNASATQMVNEEPAVVSEESIEFVRTIAKTGLEILDRIETNTIVGTIQQIGDQYLIEKIPQFLKQREISSADKDLVSNACGALAAKYSALSQYAPEGALIMWSLTHMLSYQNTMKSLKEAAIIVAKAKKATTE
jgi:hypothetical protein